MKESLSRLRSDWPQAADSLMGHAAELSVKRAITRTG